MEKASVIDKFLNKEGYCITSYQFCKNVPPKKVSEFDSIVSDIDIELYKLKDHRYSYESDKIDLLTKKCKCLECRECIKILPRN